MKQILFPIIIVFSALLSGCVTTPTSPTASQIAAADHGVKPSAEQVKTAIQKSIDSKYKDPDSALVKNTTEPEKGVLTLTSIAHGSSFKYGWLVTFEVNAKNSYGGYVGYKKESVVIRDGVILTKDR